MKPLIRRTPAAWRDIETIAATLAQDSVSAGLRFVDAAESAFDALAQMPAMGAERTFHDARIGKVRMWPIPHFENWLIFYRQTSLGIEVLRVIHTARDIQALFSSGKPRN